MRIPFFGGIDIETEADLRFALALLPTPEEIERARQAAAEERAEVFRQTGIAINEDGTIVTEAA